MVVDRMEDRIHDPDTIEGQLENDPVGVVAAGGHRTVEGAVRSLDHGAQWSDTRRQIAIVKRDETGAVWCDPEDGSLPSRRGIDERRTVRDAVEKSIGA